MKSIKKTAAGLFAAGLLGGIAAPSALGIEVINVRSGQVGGLPGLPGQLDDVVTDLPNNPPGVAISASPFTAADFAGAVSGPAAVLIVPHPAWTPLISDPLARWINWSAMPGPDGTPSGMGDPGSSLYAVPFTVTTLGATTANLSLEYAVDDWFGDWPGVGGNPDGLYANGVTTGHQGAGYASSSFANVSIPVSTGLNHLYLYQRDAGVLVSGIIFSARITVVPAPGAAALLGLGGLVAVRRRRR